VGIRSVGLLHFGDLPSCWLQIGDAANIDLARQLIQAHAYWRLKGLPVDLVTGTRITPVTVNNCTSRSWADSPAPSERDGWPGGIFVRPVEQIPMRTRSAGIGRRVIISDRRGLWRSDRWRRFRERRSALGAIELIAPNPGGYEKSRHD